jgi:hypothetical protein
MVKLIITRQIENILDKAKQKTLEVFPTMAYLTGHKISFKPTKKKLLTIIINKVIDTPNFSVFINEKYYKSFYFIDGKWIVL